MNRESIVERAKKIKSGEYKGTKLFPIAEGLESAVKYLLKRGINPSEIFTDDAEEVAKIVESSKIAPKRQSAKKKVEKVEKVEATPAASPEASKATFSSQLNELKSVSVVIFLTSEYTSENRNNESWMDNIYRHYVNYFYSMFLPVMKPASEEEFKTILTNYNANVNNTTPTGK